MIHVVVDGSEQSVFAVLADPTRRRVVELLARGPLDVSSSAWAQGGIAAFTESLPLPVTVKVVDSLGNAVSGSTVTFSQGAGNGTGGAVSPTSIKSDANGLASTQWTLGSKVGQQTLTATVVGLTAVTMQALSGRPVYTSQWDSREGNNMAHINLGREADAIVVAPASADFMAKLLHGRADDLLSLMCLARPIDRALNRL